MKKILYYFVLFLLASCSEENEIFAPIADDSSFHTSRMEKIDSFIRLTHKMETTRNVENYTITPYVIEGDTTLFAVNYPVGWQLFSNCNYAPLLLASSDFGYLDIENEISSESPVGIHIQSLANDLHVLNSALPDSLNRSSERDSLLVPIHGNLDYSQIDTLSIEQQDHLLMTKWGNNAPWNTYCRYVGGYHAQVGCAAVAVGQYLYYKHYKTGFPQYAFSHAIPPVGNDTVFSFSNLSSSIWRKMAINRFGQNTDSTAVFLASISESISDKFSTSGTYTYTSSMIRYLLNQGFDFQNKTIDYNYIIRSLRQQEPVFLSLYVFIDNKYKGHTLIVDGYRIETLQATSTIIREDGTHVTLNNRFENKFLRMNWGWDGVSDDIWFVASNAADWLTFYTNPMGTYSDSFLFESNGRREMLKLNN